MEEIFPLVYDELRRMAARKLRDERTSHTLSATALVHGEVGPGQSSPRVLEDPVVRDLATRVSVTEAPDLTARLPAERPVRVTVRMRDGAEHAGAAPNPIGDADHHPLDAAALLTLLQGWLGDDDAVDKVRRVATGLANTDHVAPLLRELAA